MSSPEVVRRSPRGTARIESILDAAAAVFARVGVERSTTNAIAVQAGISPGSLYQYFRDRSDIARALGRRYAEQLTAVHREALEHLEQVSAPLPEVLDRVLDPIVAFKDGHEAFVLLLARPGLPEDLTGPIAEVEAAFAERVEQLLQARNPDAAAAEVGLVAGTMINLFRGVVGTLGVVSGDADRDLAEVKLVLLSYLQGKGLR